MPIFTSKQPSSTPKKDNVVASKRIFGITKKFEIYANRYLDKKQNTHEEDKKFILELAEKLDEYGDNVYSDTYEEIAQEIKVSLSDLIAFLSLDVIEKIVKKRRLMNLQSMYQKALNDLANDDTGSLTLVKTCEMLKKMIDDGEVEQNNTRYIILKESVYEK